jgi:DNA polymerase-3 subunit delta'
MQFKDLIGHGEMAQHLTDMVQHNRLSHAMIFLGKEGNGGLAMALAFAQYVVCERVHPHASQSIQKSGMFDEVDAEFTENEVVDKTDSCGKCNACLKAQQFVHPDIHYSYPVIPRKAGDKPRSVDYIQEWRSFIKAQPYGNVYDWLQSIGAENKQGNITAYECSDINHKLSLKSFESDFKILIMWMPEYLGNEGNKLLKLIEEPPPNTLFIFVAENEALILQTILSRCQLIKIPPFVPAEIEKGLVENQSINPVLAAQISLISEGNYREAMHLVQHAEEDWQALLREWLNSMLKTGPQAQVKWVEEVSRHGREKQKQFLRYFNHILHQSIRLRINSGDGAVASRDADFMQRLNKIAALEQQKAIINLLDEAVWHIERNANGKMLFHALTIRIYHVIRDGALVKAWS